MHGVIFPLRFSSLKLENLAVRYLEPFLLHTTALCPAFVVPRKEPFV